VPKQKITGMSQIPTRLAIWKGCESVPYCASLKNTASRRTNALKVFRLEAVRTGFKRAWQDRDYETIIAVARKVPEDVLQEDPKLLMWYDQALTRTEAV